MVTLVYWLIIAFTYNKIRLAVDVVEASSDFMIKNKRVILVPIFYFFVKFVFMAFCITALLSV